ncbi:MAG: PTS sugar transporter subunit IIA [Sporolactobacillus sp.]
MKKILVATHGELANGIKSSLSLLVGRLENIEFINAYVTDADVTASIRHFLSELGENDQAVIFTDLKGGSVNQKVVLAVQNPNVFIIAGFNLPVVLEVLLTTEPVNETSLQKIIESSRASLQLVSRDIVSDKESEEEFFN